MTQNPFVCLGAASQQQLAVGLADKTFVAVGGRG